MYDGIDSGCVGVGSEQEAGYDSLVKLPIGSIGVRPDEAGELLTDVWIGTDQTFGGAVTVIDLEAPLADECTYVALAAADTSCNADLHYSFSIR